jgi:hypothetical protein
MDMMILSIIAAGVIFTGLISCLEVVGFGRLATVSAVIAVSSFSLAVLCLQYVPSLWEQPVDSIDQVTQTFSQIDLLLGASKAASVTTLLAATSFLITGMIRVWSRRSVLVHRIRSHHIERDGAHQANPRMARRFLLFLAVSLFTLMCSWELYHFVFTNKGIQYYADRPQMLLYSICASVIVGVVLFAIVRYAGSSRSVPQKPEAP